MNAMHASTFGRLGGGGPRRPAPPPRGRPARPVRAAAGGDADRRSPPGRPRQGRAPSPTARAALPTVAVTPSAPAAGTAAGPADAPPLASSIVPGPSLSPARASSRTSARRPLPARPPLLSPPPVGQADLAAEATYLEGLAAGLKGLSAEDKVRN